MKPPSDTQLSVIESTAAELASLAGAEIRKALGGRWAVGYKDNDRALRDPTTEIDFRVEALIRKRIAVQFPAHDVIGEELNDRRNRGHAFVWVIDPIDGTVNFIHGLPLFACSIGVLYRGQPVAGAVWCSTSKQLCPGVYHARKGRGLRFEGNPVEKAAESASHRSLAGIPDDRISDNRWEVRRIGSAAIECALVAAGALDVARFDEPNIWDVAGGVALALAGNCEVYEKRPEGWAKMERFEAGPETSSGSFDLGNWCRPLVIGLAGPVAQMCASLS